MSVAKGGNFFSFEVLLIQIGLGLKLALPSRDLSL
jgi:hypothetical protein